MYNNQITSNINSVHIIGKVITEVAPSHSFNNNMYYFTELEVRYEKTYSDIIQIFIPESSIVIDTDHIIEVGDTVELFGYLVHTKVENKFDVSVIAESINLVNKDTANINSIYLEGTIFKSYELKNSTQSGKVTKNIIIKHTSSRYKDKYFTMKAVVWNTLAKLVDSNYKEGDTIIIKGKLRSKVSQLDSGKIVNLHEALVNIVLDRDLNNSST